MRSEARYAGASPPRPARLSTPEKPMCSYAKHRVCPFRYTAAAWGAFSNFQPLGVPIAAGPWTFFTSEAVYQAAKFGTRPDVQQRIAEAPTPREAAAIGRTPGLGIDPGWNAQRVDVMRWVLRCKHEANADEIDAVLAETADRPIVEVSARDPWALRLPIRADTSRETLASDGRDIRFSPQWVARTDADWIKTAIGRVVLACALKHHTRRGDRDPERWQRASQFVTHGLLRDAGLNLPPDADAWNDISVEQAYDRLPEPKDDPHDKDGGSPSKGPAGSSASNNSDSDGSPDSTDADGETEPGNQNPSPPSFDPSGTGEVMDAGARCDDGGDTDDPFDTAAEEQAWDEAMHQAASLARAQGKAPGAIEEAIRDAHGSVLDWRVPPAPLHGRCGPSGLQLELSQRALHRPRALPAVDPLRGDRYHRRHHRHLGLPAGRDALRVLVRGPGDRRRTAARLRPRPAGRCRVAGRGRVRRRRPAREPRIEG